MEKLSTEEIQRSCDTVIHEALALEDPRAQVVHLLEWLAPLVRSGDIDADAAISKMFGALLTRNPDAV